MSSIENLETREHRSTAEKPLWHRDTEAFPLQDYHISTIEIHHIMNDGCAESLFFQRDSTS